VSRLAILGLGMITLLFLSASAVLIALPRTTDVPDVYGLRGGPAVFGMVLTIVGVAIALRQPRNGVGWIFLISGMFAALLGAAIEYASYALVERGGSLPGGEWAIWLTQFSVPLVEFPILTNLLLVFPNGQLPSARWRPVAWYATSAMVALIAIWTLLVTPVGYGDLSTPNPIALGVVISMDQRAQSLIAQILLGPPTILCAGAFVLRFWRSQGVERQQLKWVAYAAVITVAVLLGPPSSGIKPLEVAKELITLAVPLAAGIAILRYRLYDIDLIINRTLVYGATSAAIAATFFVGIVALQALLRPLMSGSELAIAASTLVSFALFQPIRRRVQGAVDRRFDRSRYDAARTLDAFADRLRDEVDLDALRTDLLDAVRQTIAPAYASLWLREGAMKQRPPRPDRLRTRGD